MVRFLGKAGYIFTDKKNPKWGIMSSILGLTATVSIVLAVHLAYRNQGAALMQYGAAVLLAAVYAVIGLVLGIRSLAQKDIFRFFPVTGIVFNAVAFAASGFILYLGTVH